MTEELKRFIALWENAVCEIRAENSAGNRNPNIDLLCTKLESSMVAYSRGNVEYARGNVEYAHFTI